MFVNDILLLHFSRGKLHLAKSNVVNAIQLFGGNLEFPKIKKLSLLYLMSESAQNVKSMNAICKQNFTLKLFIAVQMAYSCCFS